MPKAGGPGPVRDHFSNTAHQYGRHRPRYPAELGSYLASRVHPGALAWEVGCGSGQLSTTLADAGARVVASDASSQQIAEAPRKPRLHYLVERAEASALGTGVARLCVCAQAAHWFDLEQYYSEVRRVGVRGGVVALITYGRVAGPPALTSLIDHLYNVVLAPHWPAERAHVENAYGRLPFPFDEVQPPEFHLQEDWTADAFLGYVSTWSAVSNLLRSGGEDGVLVEYAAALRSKWAQAEPVSTFRWPVTMRVGVI